MEIVKVSNLTKDYGNKRGVFDISFTLKEGEVLGFLGPNGAGKTTTIRNIMGFINPDKGEVKVKGLDAFTESHNIQKEIGFLPGEIAFFSGMTGKEFIDFNKDYKGIKDNGRIKDLMERFELDPNHKIKKMSKGTKQKIGLVCAFMGDPSLYILDEPTSGLDPLMQIKFVELIREEALKGKSILMSSHIFEEVEKTCSRTVIIREGRIVAVENLDKLKKNLGKDIEITFKTDEDLKRFISIRSNSRVYNDEKKVVLEGEKDMPGLIRELSKFDILDLSSNRHSLEDVFIHYYGGEK